MKNQSKMNMRICAMGLASAMIITAPSIAFANGKGQSNGVGNGKAPVGVVEQQPSKVEAQIQKVEVKLQKVEEKLVTVQGKAMSLQQAKAEIVKTYSEAEIQQITKAGKKIQEENKNVKILPFNSVVDSKGKMKFDTPPVIKGGRTLVPVRAITQGLGATVAWNEETREVTITKGDTTIVIKIDSNIVLVNGVEVKIDAPAEVLTSRTYVPLRFIAETFKLKVEWNQETETIIIDETEETEEAEDVEDVEDVEEAEEAEETEEVQE